MASRNSEDPPEACFLEEQHFSELVCVIQSSIPVMSRKPLFVVGHVLRIFLFIVQQPVFPDESSDEELLKLEMSALSLDLSPENAESVNKRQSISIWEPEQMRQDEKRDVLNDALQSISSGRISPIQSTLTSSWESISERQKRYYVKKAKDVLEAAMSVLAPGQEAYLREAILRTPRHTSFNDVPTTTQSVIQAYLAADSWQIKRQILSLITDEYTKEELRDLIPGLSVWRIDQARRHKTEAGPGQPIPKHALTRTRLDKVKTDHFIDFISSPALLQDVAYGTKTLSLDNGEKITVPAAIRTAIPSRIVATYRSHCKNTGFETTSERTLYRILDACSASLQKSLQGLDNYTAEGSEAFDNMQKIVEALSNHGVIDDAWYKGVSKRLKNGKDYLKVDFKSHVAVADWCADHCSTYALSDPTDVKFASDCEHDHDMICERCEDLREVLSDIQQHINNTVQMTKEELARLQFQYSNSFKAILDWKGHILRTINQEKAKQDILGRISDRESCFIIMDWAMKFLPMVYREKMSDFFGKRGRSWHVSAIITAVSNGDFNVECLVHLFDSCKQDWYAVASILENTLRIVKQENGNVKNAYLKSDNAGCYHNAQLLSSVKDIGRRTGINILRYDFSDPQSGKDVCDRKLAHMKAHIRRFVNEHNDVTTASEMKMALESYGGVKGCRYAVAEIKEPVERGETKWKGISYLYNFSFENPDSVHAWKAFGVGNGEDIAYKSRDADDTNLDLKIVEGFGSPEESVPGVFTAGAGKSYAGSTLFHCQENGCVSSFSTLEDLDQHMSVGKHMRMLERETAFDAIKKKWAQKLTGIASGSSNLASCSACSTRVYSTRTSERKKMPDQGWALKKKSSSSRMTKKTKEWMKQKFDEGVLTKKKADATKVAREMQYIKDDKGNLRFSPSEWRTVKQITSLFSRLASKGKSQGIGDEGEDVTDEGVSDGGSDEEVDTQEEAVMQLRRSVYTVVDFVHPIKHGDYNICHLAGSAGLGHLKIKELQIICRDLEIEVVGAKNRKKPYIDALQKLANTCTCCTVNG